ncbi:MAG: septum formation initiator family protein [Candidatus Margulisiibacteriota bacterium]
MKRLGWLLFFFFLLYFIFLIRQDIIDYLELRAEKGKMTRELSRQSAGLEWRQKRLSRLKADELIEELARTRLGLIKKGETAYKVIN